MNHEDSYIKEQVSRDNWEIIQRLIEEGKINFDARTTAKLWPLFVNIEKRRKTELPFLLEQLREYRAPNVFVSSLGSGVTSIELILSGINVVSNEIDNDLLRVAEQEAKKHKIRLCVTRYDWRELTDHLFTKFDAVTNLGNSLTLLFKEKDQLKSLKNFYEILKSKGKLIIDERNYAEHFLKGGGSNYKYTGNVVYCGIDKLDAYPIYISSSMVIMEYSHKISGEKVHLVMYPFKAGELKKLLTKTGFKDIRVYGDYQEDFDPRDPEFLTYVCRKI